MGIAIAAGGTAMIWLSRIGNADSAAWPAVMATVGFWVLGALLTLLRRR